MFLPKAPFPLFVPSIPFEKKLHFLLFFLAMKNEWEVSFYSLNCVWKKLIKLSSRENVQKVQCKSCTDRKRFRKSCNLQNGTKYRKNEWRMRWGIKLNQGKKSSDLNAFSLCQKKRSPLFLSGEWCLSTLIEFVNSFNSAGGL